MVVEDETGAVEVVESVRSVPLAELRILQGEDRIGRHESSSELARLFRDRLA